MADECAIAAKTLACVAACAARMVPTQGEKVSYCRWSSDDFQCDVYVYEDVGGGWTTHVAGSRYVHQKEMPPLISFLADPDGWFKRHEEVKGLIDAAGMETIKLPHAGESFNDPTPQACADRLESLRALGYIVPQYAIDTLREEAEDE